MQMFLAVDNVGRTLHHLGEIEGEGGTDKKTVTFSVRHCGQGVPPTLHTDCQEMLSLRG